MSFAFWTASSARYLAARSGSELRLDELVTGSISARADLQQAANSCDSYTWQFVTFVMREQLGQEASAEPQRGSSELRCLLRSLRNESANIDRNLAVDRRQHAMTKERRRETAANLAGR